MVSSLFTHVIHAFYQIQSAGLLSRRVQISNSCKSTETHVCNLKKKFECIEFIDEWEIWAKQIIKTNHVETYNWNEPQIFGLDMSKNIHRIGKRKERKIKYIRNQSENKIRKPKSRLNDVIEFYLLLILRCVVVSLSLSQKSKHNASNWNGQQRGIFWFLFVDFFG